MKNHSKVTVLGLALAMALFAVSCTPHQAQVARTSIDAAAAACEVVMSATDPGLSPICTTAQAIAQAIASLVEANSKAIAASGVKPALAPYQPTGDEVYAYLAAHGARPIER